MKPKNERNISEVPTEEIKEMLTELRKRKQENEEISNRS